MSRQAVMMILVFVTTALFGTAVVTNLSAENIPGIFLANDWPSPVSMPAGAEKFSPERYTQSIYVLNNSDVIEKVFISTLKTKWHVSGGMVGIGGWKSHKYRTLPSTPRTWIGQIGVENSLGYVQHNFGVKRSYPVGSRFDDILTRDGQCFEHRVREKTAKGWKSRVVYKDESARPKGYKGLSISCAECHEEAGTGSYGAGLVPGGDTVLSDPMPWKVAGKLLRER